MMEDETIFVLDPERWAEFLALLDRPPVEKPRLRALMEDQKKGR